MLIRIGEVLYNSNAASHIKAMAIPVMGSAFIANLLETLQAIRVDVILTTGLGILGLATGCMVLVIKMYEHKQAKSELSKIILEVEEKKLDIIERTLDVEKLRKEIAALDRRCAKECADEAELILKQREHAKRANKAKSVHKLG
jgi:hypothetical protein